MKTPLGQRPWRHWLRDLRLTLAVYATAIAPAAVAAGRFGTDRTGDWLTTGSAVLLVGIAAAAAFGFLALANVRALMRRG